MKRIAACLLLGCSAPTTTVEIGILRPEGDSRLEATDNVTITFQPDGFVDAFATDGLEFALEAELDPDATPRELAVYLAQGETLLAYGRTPPFVLRTAAGIGVQVFVAYPQALSTLPFTFDFPDPNTLAAPALGYGTVALGSDGTTAFLDPYTYDLELAERLEAVPAPDDGVFVGDAAGGAVRIAWASGVIGHRFDVLQDAWTELTFSGADAAEPRPGAIAIPFGTDRLLLLGGGDRLDTLDVAYTWVDATPSAVLGPPSFQLDAPRVGATAIAIDFGSGIVPLVVGGDDPSLPRVLAAWSFAMLGDDARAGPTEAWTGLRCTTLDAAGTPMQRVLCAGGMRADAPTADGLLVTVTAEGRPEVVELAALLPAPMADVLWQADDAAVYAQGDGRWVRIARADLAVSEPPAAVQRARGGCSVPLETGFTLVVGGTDIAGAPTNRWQVFAPALSDP